MISDKEVKIVEEAVRSAGKMLWDARPDESTVHAKEGPANFVTDYDVKIQEYLIERLSAVFDGAQFYGEEDTAGSTGYVGDGYTFFIDPIDGTTNLMFDYQNSCVSVGLAEGGVMTAGWVFNPYTDRMYVAASGQGATLNGRMIAGWVCNPYSDQFWSAEKGKGAFLNGRRLKIENKGLEAGICAFGCARYNEGDIVFSVLKEIFMNSLSVRNGGSAAIDLCRIASGSNVGYVEMKLQPYDYAAASVIIEEAGGYIGQPDGSAITLDRPCPIVAGTHKAAEELKNILLFEGFTKEKGI